MSKLLRCYYCNKLLFEADLQVDGTCQCGSRKIRLAFAITDQEMAEVTARGFVPEEGQLTTKREDAWKPE